MGEDVRNIFHDNLLKYMKLRGKSQTDISKDLNISLTTVSGWYHGKNFPRPDKMQLLADYLHVNVEDLIKDKGYEIPEYFENAQDAIEYDNIYKIDTIKLPLLGTVACGEPIFADEDRESYILVGTDINADFCLKCKGDSMINARIYDGDIVFVRKQDIVNNGEIAVVIIDDEATLKRFYYYREQNLVILKPENPKYKDIVLTGEELDKVKVLGKAVAFQSDVI